MTEANMASRIDPARAKLSPPSNELFRHMAEVGMTAVDEYTKSLNLAPFIGIDPTEIVEIFDTAARAMYGVLAQRGGGNVYPISEEPKEPK